MTKRVVHVISTPEGIGGAEQAMLAIAAAAEARGWQTHILNPFSLSAESEIARRSTCEVEVFPARSWTSLPPLRRWLEGRLREIDPDVVHAHLFHALVSVATLRKHDRATILSHQHGDRMRSEGHRYKVLLDRWGGRRFDRVVACSEWVRRFLINEYHYPESLVSTIQNGWAGSPKPRDPDADPTIVCVANFRPAKGHLVLIEAFGRVLERLPNARLILIGTGPLGEEIRKRLYALGLTGHAELAGSTDDVWQFFARAHVAVQPSLAETFGISVLESSAAGLPVVASRVGGLPEIVEDGVSGVLVPPGDVEKLAEALYALLSDPQRAAKLGEAGSRIAKGMTTERMVDEYYALYEGSITAGRRAV